MRDWLELGKDHKNSNAGISETRSSKNLKVQTVEAFH